MIPRTAFVLFSMLSLACSGSPGAGDKVDLDAFLFSAVTGQTLPATAPAISVYGRSADEFKVDYKDKTQITGSLQLKIHDLPNQEYMVFQISGSGLETTSTFPLAIDTASFLEFGALVAGMREFLIQCVTQVDYQQGLCSGVLSATGVNLSTQAIIMGTVDPIGNCTVRQVDLLNPETKLSVLENSLNGPFYFHSSGDIQNSGRMLDSQCNYIIYNVIPGRYLLQFRYDTTTENVPVIAFGGSIIVGYNVPR